jgi:hypothetical protein
MFADEWAQHLEKAIARLPQGWTNDTIVRELLETISACGDYSREQDLEKSKTSLQALLSEEKELEERASQRQ